MIVCHQEYEDFAAISKILFDSWQLVGRSFKAIELHPEHISTTALSLAPDCSLVELYAGKAYSNCLISQREPKWGSYLQTLGGSRDETVFSRDGQLLALIDRREIEIRDTTTGCLRKTLENASWIEVADVHPTNRSLISVSLKGVVQEWDLMSDTDVRTYEPSEENWGEKLRGRKAAYNADGSRIACCWRDADAILVWSTGDRSQPVNRIPIGAGLTFNAFSLDCNRDQIAALITPFYRDKPTVVRYWNIDTGEDIKSLQITGYAYAVWRAAFAKKNTMLVTDHMNEIRVWDLEGDRATLTTAIHLPLAVDAFDVTRSGEVVVVGCDDFAIRLYDAQSGAKLAVYRGHNDYLWSLRFSPQGDRLVSTSHDGTTRVWDTTREALSANPPSAADECLLKRIKFSPNGTYIAAIVSDDHRVIVWDGETGKYLTTLASHAKSVATFAFSTDGSILATISKDGVIVLWDMRREIMHPWTLSQSESTNSPKPVDMAFNADSKLLAIVYKIDHWSYVVKLYDVSFGVELFQSKPYFGGSPHLIQFSSDEPAIRLRHVAPGKEIKIWDLATDTVQEHPYNDNVHATWLPFNIEDQWIVSSRNKRKLFWLPWYRTPRGSACMDVHGDRLAVGSCFGTLTLLDVSCLQAVQQ
jgi:WD40 repeat protein